MVGCLRSGVSATASPPTRLPAQYSPALPGGTTRFGMGRGGTRALSATPTPDLTQPCGPHQRARGTRWRSVPTHRHRHGAMVGRRAAGTAGMQHAAMTTLDADAGGPSARWMNGESALDHEDGLAPVGYPLSTGRLLTRSSSGGLTLDDEKAHLGAGFPLRCCQRLSLPDVATQHCRFSDNWPTSGLSSPVLSY